MRASCSACEATFGGSRPRSFSASRSASVNAVPLLSAGSCNIATPFGSVDERPGSGASWICCSMTDSPSGLARLNPSRRASNRFRNHLDRPAGALGHAQSAALAEIVVELETLAGTELHHGVVRADA